MTSSALAPPADLATPAVERLFYHLVVAQGPGVLGRVYVNDLPVYEDPKTPHFESTTNRINHFLVPGKNVIRIEVDQMGDESNAMFFAHVMRDPDEHAEPVKHHSLMWPHATAELPEPPASLVPFAWQNEFEIEADHLPPYYADKKPEQVPLEGTPELRAAVKQFHDALVERDAAKMTELTWFEAQDSARYYPTNPPPSKAAIQSTYAGGFDAPWDVPKWDPDRLLFTQRAGGRLVHVTGLDGRHAITGQHTVRPRAHFLLNPLLVRHDGKWELYR